MDRRRLSGELQRADREPDRMAGEGGSAAASTGRRNRIGNKQHRAQRELASALAGRAGMPRVPRTAFSLSLADILKLLLLAAVLLAAVPTIAGEKIIASRVWPAQEYTRVTFESAHAIKHQSFSVPDPDRLVVDLEGVELDAEIKALQTKVGEGDPYIRA